MTSFFEQYPEFVELDSRRLRGFSPVTVESLDVRHAVSLPAWLVAGNSVLDLGSCLGATGAWSLANGCSSYTGVEAQTQLVEQAEFLFEQYFPDSAWEFRAEDIRSFLADARAQGQRWDVVICIGVVYAFLDTYGLLESIAHVCDYAVVIDSIYPWNMLTADVSIIDVIRGQHINSAEDGLAYTGAGARPSPAALRIMMETLGFESREGLLYPEALADNRAHDTYHTPIVRPGTQSYPSPARYLTRFFRTDSSTLRPVADRVVSEDRTEQVPMARAPVQPVAAAQWQFDSSVAARFQQEAECHIPDYQRVIDLTQAVVDNLYPGERAFGIIDVGSALGHTMRAYRDRGYTDVWGVDNSEAMRAASQFPEQVILSTEFPQDRSWRVVLANWTLHFVQEREQYLEDIYHSLEAGGTLIISDKMTYTSLEERLYHNFKRSNGISQAEIDRKQQSLVGVLTPRPLEWYTATLARIGFSDIAVINSRYMFHTIYARRY